MRFRFVVMMSALLALPLCAHADSFLLAFSGSGEAGSVLLTARATGSTGEYLISAASGFIDGKSASSLLPNTYPSSGPNDNLLFYPASSSALQANFDTDGVSFLLAGDTDYNLYGQAGQYFAQIGEQQAVDDISSVAVTPVVASTPEPGTLALLGTGLLALMIVATRRGALVSQ